MDTRIDSIAFTSMRAAHTLPARPLPCGVHQSFSSREQVQSPSTSHFSAAQNESTSSVTRFVTGALVVLSQTPRETKRRTRYASKRRRVVTYALGEDSATSEADLLASAKDAAEAAKLELEAAKLRAEAEELERANIEERRRVRARQLLGDGGSFVRATDLRSRILEATGVAVSDDAVERLMKEIQPGASLSELKLSFEDLLSDRFQKSLDGIISEEQELLRRKQQEENERERLKMEEARKLRAETFDASVSADENDDRSIWTRVMGCLAYLLPLMDVVQFGIPLLGLLPFLTPIFVIIAIPAAIVNAVPFGTLILFFAMSALSGNQDFPRLLRFNLQQAVLIDVALFLPQFLAQLATLVVGGQGVPTELTIGVFIIVMLAITYSIVMTLLGRDPDGIPGISNAARNSIDRRFRR